MALANRTGRRTYLLIIFGSLIVAAQMGVAQESAKLHGVVVYAENGVALRKASVIVYMEASHQIKTIPVDEKGRIETVIAPGYFDVFVVAPGFEPMCKRFRVSSGGEAHFDARLRASDETLIKD